MSAAARSDRTPEVRVRPMPGGRLMMEVILRGTGVPTAEARPAYVVEVCEAVQASERPTDALPDGTGMLLRAVAFKTAGDTLAVTKSFEDALRHATARARAGIEVPALRERDLK